MGTGGAEIMRKIGMAGWVVLLLLSIMVSAAMAAQPVALVEESHGAVVGVGDFDMLTEGQSFDLGKDAILVLGYLQSCIHERIEGGLVTVGREQSEVRNGGKVRREQVECGGGSLLLSSAQAQASGGIVLRKAVKSHGTARVVHSTRPFFLTRSPQDIVLTREGNPGESHRLPSHCRSEGRCGVDLAETALSLQPGASYQVRSGSAVVLFSIADDAVESATQPPATLLERIVFIR